jgi:hypothetical protein
MSRTIVYDKSFDEAIELLGGYRLLDQVLDAVIDGLRINPYAFTKFENDFISFRYAVTETTSDFPPLVIVFRIEANGSVVLEHIEENFSY